MEFSANLLTLVLKPTCNYWFNSTCYSCYMVAKTLIITPI
jgi:hypothetical protein